MSLNTEPRKKTWIIGIIIAIMTYLVVKGAIGVYIMSIGGPGEFARRAIAKGHVDSIDITVKPLVLDALPPEDRADAIQIFALLDSKAIKMKNEDIAKLDNLGQSYISSRNQVYPRHSQEEAHKLIIQLKKFVDEIN